MAGDWMKIELELPDKPEVHAMSGILNLDSDSVVGKLIRVWQWFDKHTTDGNAYGVTLSLPDRISGVTGFGEAMMFVGWLEQNDKNLTMPKFDKHTSQSAKQRALTAKRVEKLRNENVTVAALPREEKRREDIKPKTPSAAFALPDWIDRPTWANTAVHKPLYSQALHFHRATVIISFQILHQIMLHNLATHDCAIHQY